MSSVAIQPQAMETLTIHVPKVDMKRLKGIAKAMGWTVEVKPKQTTRDVARIICTEEEYQRLEAEGFLDNPQPQFGPFTEEEIMREIEEGEKEGYLSVEETAAWLNKLAAL